MNVMHLETRVIAKSILFAVLNWRRQWSHITQLKLPPNPKLFEASSFRSPFDEYLDLLHRIHHTLLEMCINLPWWCLISTCWISKKNCLYPPDPNSHGNSLTPASPQVGSNRFLGVADKGGGPGAPQLTLEGEVVAFQLRAAEVLNPRRNGDFMGDFNGVYHEHELIWTHELLMKDPLNPGNHPGGYHVWIKYRFHGDIIGKYYCFSWF
jgi:hypothetical protein